MMITRKVSLLSSVYRLCLALVFLIPLEARSDSPSSFPSQGVLQQPQPYQQQVPGQMGNPQNDPRYQQPQQQYQQQPLQQQPFQQPPQPTQQQFQSPLQGQPYPQGQSYDQQRYQQQQQQFQSPPQGLPATGGVPPGGPCVVKLSTDRSTIHFMDSATGIERKLVSLGEDRVQKVFNSPDGTWSVAIFKIRGISQYGFLAIDLGKCEEKQPVDIPSVATVAVFDQGEVDLTFEAGVQRFKLKNQ